LIEATMLRQEDNILLQLWLT